MDRRTLLAFLMIFLVFSGYSFVMKKYYPPEEPEISADSTMTNVAVEEATAVWGEAVEDPGTSVIKQPAVPNQAIELTTADAALSQINVPQPAVVSVSGPLFELEIDTRGGRISSWHGMNYSSWQGGTIQLIPESRPAKGLDALIFRGTDFDLANLVFVADQPALVLREDSGESTLTLTADLAGGMSVRKIFTFRPETYGFEVDYVLAANSGQADESLVLTGVPEAFRFGWNQGIAPTERVQKMELQALRSFARVGDESHYKKRSGLKKSTDKVSGQWLGSVHFAGLQNRYFTVVGVVPQESGDVVEGVIRVGGDKETMSQSWTIDLPARRGVGEEIATARLDYYIGPQEVKLLGVYGQRLEDSLDLGWKFFRPLSKLVLVSMQWMHRYISNYGVIIILLSVISKLMMYPLTRTSTKSMKKMQELQPKMKALQEKYKDDKDKLNKATMELYAKEKVNPLTGCLPMLVQSPVFIALYQALNHTIALRGQPFMLWISDLSQPDAIATLPMALPFLGSDLNVLPILMSVAMYFQSKFTPNSGGGQMAAMNTMMPLFMIFIFYNMPSGLVLYWLVNTLMQGYQSWKIQSETPKDGGIEAT